MRRGGRLVHLLAVVCAALMFETAPVPAAAPPQGAFGLAVTVRPEKVPVGGTFRLILAYALPAGASLGKVPDIRGIEGLSVVKREAEDGRIVLTVLADSLDPIGVGPVELGYTDAKRSKGVLRSGTLTVGVVSGLKGEEELRPIKGIIPTDHRWLRRALAAGIALLVLAALAAAFFSWRKRHRGGSGAGSVEAPHVRAEREMNALLKENLFEQGRQKEFYFLFTEIIKRYVGALRSFPALEYTTEEISVRVADADCPVLSILRFADLVKFADEIAAPARKDDDVSTFLAYLDVTSPRAPEEGRGDAP